MWFPDYDMIDARDIRHSMYANLVLYETYAFFDIFFGVNGRVRNYYSRNVTSNNSTNNTSQNQ